MKFYQRPRRQPQVIIVSLIDIFAILLIFVIVTTTFKREQPEVLIKLPESSQAAPAESPSEEPAVLSISKDESLFLDRKPLSPEDLPAVLAELKQAGRSIALNADEKAPLGLVVKVMDASKAAGYTDLPLWTEPSAP